MLGYLKGKVKRFIYRLTLLSIFVAVIIVGSGVLTPSITYATDSGEEATDSETPVSNTETASSEVIQTSDSEADTQSAVEEEEPVAATTEASALEEPSPSATVTEIVTAGGDDSSYFIPLEAPILFDGVYYSNVYATTNSVLSFGQADGTYWDYPLTPSISIASRDWWARPYAFSDEWFIIRTSSGGFQVDGSYRPFGSNSGSTTNIVITAQILSDGTVNYTYSVVGDLYGGERTGARLHDGTVVALEDAGINEVDEPTVLEPEPVEPEPEPTPSEPETGPSGEEVEISEPQSSPTPAPSPLPTFVEPERIQPLPSQPAQATPQPAQEQPQEPQRISSPEPNPQRTLEEVINNPDSSVQERVDAIIATLSDGDAVSVDVLLEAGISFEDLPPETPVEIREDEDGNAVVIDAQTAAALVVLSSPEALIEELLTNPVAVLAALASVGKDMSPTEREESQEIVVASVIVSGIAGAATNASAIGVVAAYRRKP